MRIFQLCNGRLLPDDYAPPIVPDAVAQFLQHVQGQTDVLTELSAAGFAFTIALWAAAHGILLNFKLAMTRWSILLPVTAAFLASINALLVKQVLHVRHIRG